MPLPSTLEKFRGLLAKRKSQKPQLAVGHKARFIGSTTATSCTLQTGGTSQQELRVEPQKSLPLAEPEPSVTEIRHEYEYNRIDPPFIRVIKLQPGDWNDPVECTLSTFDLDTVEVPNDSPYETLSYVWGDASQRREILVKGVPFSVTRSLYEALQILRRPAGGSARTIWYVGQAWNV